jgi:hypothetical protein
MGGGRLSRRRLLLLALPVVVALVVAGAVWLARPKKTEVTLEVYPGTPGLAFEGKADVDGTSRDLTGTVPARFVLEGYRVTYSLTSAEDAGEFRVKATIGGAAVGSAGSLNPPKNGVRGWVRSGWGRSEPDQWIESFPKDDSDKWLKPPPE